MKRECPVLRSAYYFRTVQKCAGAVDQVKEGAEKSTTVYGSTTYV